MLLLSDSSHQFQTALNIVTKWARKIRMRLNIGADKSAAMIINDAGLTAASSQWQIGLTTLPIVSSYKYLGQALQNTGRWDEWLKTVIHKTRQRTTELVRWARSNHITIDILARLWVLYVEKAAGWEWQLQL